MSDHHLDDVPLWGAAAIGRAAGLITDDGSVDLRKTFRLLELRLLPARKLGKTWVTTPRQLRAAFEVTSPELAQTKQPDLERQRRIAGQSSARKRKARGKNEEATARGYQRPMTVRP